MLPMGVKFGRIRNLADGVLDKTVMDGAENVRTLRFSDFVFEKE
jgi:hypothetical protein